MSFFFFFSLMMPYLGLENQTLKVGLVHGETSLLGQEATQERPIRGPTPDKDLLGPTPDKDLLGPTLDKDLLGPTLDKDLLGPTLAQQHLLILDQLHRVPTPDLGPTRLLHSQVPLEPTLLPAPMAFLLDPW